jgi:hypothetical protein
VLKENTLAATLDDLSQLMLRQIFVDECLIREIEPDSEIGLKLEHCIKHGFLSGITEERDLIHLASNLLNPPDISRR